MGKAVLGFADLTTDCHGAMASWMQRPTKRKLGLAPRDHLKTSVWTIADTIRCICVDPNSRTLIINETASNAQNWLSRIEGVFERNAVFRWLFPELIPDFTKVRWTREAMEVPRTAEYPEATVEVFGVGGASTSRHYSRVREDDLVGREASQSPALMQKAIDQHKLAESLLNDPHDTISTVGTRWAPYDLVKWMVAHEGDDLDYFTLEVFHPSGHRKEGQPIWPARFSAEYLDGLRRKLGPGMFNLQYMNKALAEGVTDLDPNWLRRWNWTRVEVKKDGIWHEEEGILLERPQSEGGPVAYTLDQLWTFEVVDPCHSPESGKARAAVLVVGLTPDEPFNIIILHAWAKKTTPNATIEEAYAAHRRFRTIACGIEIVGAQLTYFYWIPTVYPEMPIRKLKSSTALNAKVRRIREVAPSFGEQGRIYTHPSMSDFHEEWESFPSGETVDLLDALSYAPQIWSPPIPDDRGVIRNPADDDDDDDKIILDGRNQFTGY